MKATINETGADILRPKTLDSLLATHFPATRWLVEGLLPTEGITIISAAPGSFKTWLMLEIALCVTQGHKLFNMYATTQTGVLLIDEESGPRMLSERFKQLQAPNGLPIVYFSREGRRISSTYIDSLLEACTERQIGLIVIDSLVRIHQGDENASKDMSELFNQLRRLADNGISVLIAHHNRKSIPGSYSPSGDMRGSSDILAAVDCHLALQRHKGGSYIEIRQTKNRYARESSPFKLRFTEKEGFNQFEFVGAIQSKSDRYEELKSTVLRVIEQSPLLTKKLLLEKVQAGKVDIKLKGLGNILDELMLDGLVRFQQGSRNAVHYYLAGDGESAPKTQ